MKPGIEAIVRQACRQIEKHDLNYEDFQRAARLIRERAGLKRPKQAAKLPKLLTHGQLKVFFQEADQAPAMWGLLFRLLLATAVRVAELAAIKNTDINFDQLEIFIEKGKGDQDRVVPFPAELAPALRLQAERTDKYLFESKRGQLTTRAIQKRMANIATAAGLVDDDKPIVSPHLFRHQTTTYLLNSGMPKSKVMVITGHRTETAFEIYNHLSLGQLQDHYQQVISGQHVA